MNSTDALRNRVRGQVIEPGESDYDTHRQVYNAMHDRRPAVIVRCADAADVMEAVNHATDHGLDIAVRGGAHSVPGFGTCDDGLVIDLAPIRNVSVDPGKRVARVGGGATQGDLDHATHAFGLATTGGMISTTGVGGLTLGGGFGHLTRGCGLTVDNLISATVVTADGRHVTASDYQNTDLFWALRGGGGNFGVVTEFEFQLHPCDTVIGGPLLYEADDARAVMEMYREFMRDAPDALGCFFGWQIAPPLPFIPEDRVGDLFAAIVPCWNGPAAEAGAVLNPLREGAGIVAEHLGPVPYPALNSAFDALVPPGLQHYWKADFVTELTDDAITAHIEYGANVPCVNTIMHIYPLDGAVQRVAPEETAFAHRDKEFVTVIAGAWPEPTDNAANKRWVKDYYDAIHPHSGSDGGYTNFMSDDDDHRAEANYGANYERLTEVKKVWDPHNVFHLNQNIAPAK